MTSRSDDGTKGGEAVEGEIETDVTADKYNKRKTKAARQPKGPYAAAKENKQSKSTQLPQKAHPLKDPGVKTSERRCEGCGCYMLGLEPNKHHLIMCDGCSKDELVCQICGMIAMPCKELHFTCPKCKVEQLIFNKGDATGTCYTCDGGRMPGPNLRRVDLQFTTLKGDDKKKKKDDASKAGVRVVIQCDGCGETVPYSSDHDTNDAQYVCVPCRSIRPTGMKVD